MKLTEPRRLALEALVRAYPDPCRDAIIRCLRVEGIEQCRAVGCTCDPEPKMILIEAELGGLKLPVWKSEHPDECGAKALYEQLEADDA